MLRAIAAILVAACLVALSACTEEAPPPTPMIEVQDQSIQDGTVTINAAIDKPGWLVLYPATSEGEPDTATALVTGYLSAAGEYNDISLEITGDFEEETTLFAMLHYDEPADEEYTFVPDGVEDPPVEVNGTVVSDSFEMGG